MSTYEDELEKIIALSCFFKYLYINSYVLSVDISVQARNFLHRRLSRPLKTMAIVAPATSSPFSKKRKLIIPSYMKFEKKMNAEVPIPMTQEEFVPRQTIIPKERITQQHDEMNVHWTKQPAQRVADVSLRVALSAHGPYFLYEDELSRARWSVVGMPAPSITRSHYIAQM